MKSKLLKVTFLLFLPLGMIATLDAKPKINYTYEGSFLRFWFGGYGCVSQVSNYEYVDGVLKVTRIDVDCKEPGDKSCDAEYLPVVGTGQDGDWFNEAELSTIADLIAYAGDQVNNGNNTGTHSQSVTIQQGNDPPYTIVFTINWNDNDGTVEILNEIL